MRGNGIDAALAPWTLWSLGAEGQEPNPLTDALVHYLVIHQKTDGHWTARVNRPPHDASQFTFTALAIRGLQLYAPKGRGQEMQTRIARARDWLTQAQAAETEDKASRLHELAASSVASSFSIVKSGASPKRFANGSVIK